MRKSNRPYKFKTLSYNNITKEVNRQTANQKNIFETIYIANDLCPEYIKTFKTKQQECKQSNN